MIEKIIELTGIDIRKKSRKREVVYVRQMYYHLRLKYMRCSKNSLCKDIGQNHATILHALKECEKWLKFDKQYKSDYQRIEKLFQNETKLFKLSRIEKLIDIMNERITGLNILGNETLRNMWAKRLGNLVIMKYKETK